MKTPLKILGIIFSVVASIELVALAVFWLVAAPVAPYEAKLVLTLVLGIQSIVFGSIGFGFLAHIRKRSALREDLLAGGYYETAQVVETERVYNVQINGRRPYRVICRTQRDGVLHEYRSEMLSADPGLMPGDDVRVYLDRRDDKRYYVDVESAAPTIIRH